MAAAGQVNATRERLDGADPGLARPGKARQRRPRQDTRQDRRTQDQGARDSVLNRVALSRGVAGAVTVARVQCRIYGMRLELASRQAAAQDLRTRENGTV